MRSEIVMAYKFYDVNDFMGTGEYVVNIKDNRIKKVLNKKIWDENEELLDDVREAVECITETFKEEVKNYGINLRVVDTYLLGSNAGYNYNNNSDLDVHIVIDKKKEECNKKHLRAICDMAKKIFNDKYDVDINGVTVEVYVEFEGEIANKSPNMYSLKEGWLKREPRPEEKDIDEEKVKSITDRYIKKVETCLKHLGDNPDKAIERLERLIADIHELRHEGLKVDEFDSKNLAYKDLRAKGYITKLKTELVKQRNKKMSV